MRNEEPRKRASRHGIPLWLIYVVSALLILAIAVALTLGFYIEPLLEKKIAAGVAKSSKGLYKVSFSDIDVSLFRGRARFSGLTLKPDLQKFNGIKKTEDAPKYLLNVKVDDILISDISPISIYFKRIVALKAITIDQPVIQITYFGTGGKKDTTEKKTAYQLISKFLKSLSVNEININNADLKYVNKSTEETSTSEFKHLEVNISDVKIDSAAQFDKSRFYYCRDIFFQLRNHTFKTRNGLYHVFMDDIRCSTKGRFLKVSRLRMKPLFPEMEFSRKYKTQHDRYDISVGEIRFNDIDFNRFDTEKGLFASSLLIDRGNIKVFMNRALPPVTFDKGRNYPHVALRRLSIPLKIDTLIVRNTDVSYTEYNPKAERKGTISFNDLKVRATNVTNDTPSLKKDHWARVRASARVMNQGNLNVEINFNLISPAAAFNFNGTIGKMDLRVLNPVTKNLAMAEIESGVIDRAKFQVAGDWNKAHGEIRFYYHDLKVNLLTKDDNSQKLEEKGPISALANTLVVTDKNPGNDGKLRLGKTDADRGKDKSFFSLMWKSVFAGIKESAGLTLTETEKVKVKLSKREQRKAKRERKREARQEKKEERKEDSDKKE